MNRVQEVCLNDFTTQKIKDNQRDKYKDKQIKKIVNNLLDCLQKKTVFLLKLLKREEFRNVFSGFSEF